MKLTFLDSGAPFGLVSLAAPRTTVPLRGDGELLAEAVKLAAAIRNERGDGGVLEVQIHRGGELTLRALVACAVLINASEHTGHDHLQPIEIESMQAALEAIDHGKKSRITGRNVSEKARNLRARGFKVTPRLRQRLLVRMLILDGPQTLSEAGLETGGRNLLQFFGSLPIASDKHELLATLDLESLEKFEHIAHVFFDKGVLLCLATSAKPNAAGSVNFGLAVDRTGWFSPDPRQLARAISITSHPTGDGGWHGKVVAVRKTSLAYRLCTMARQQARAYRERLTPASFNAGS